MRSSIVASEMLCSGIFACVIPKPDIRRAVELHRSGRLREAERMYRAILAVEASHPLVLRYLGRLCDQTGRRTEAIHLLRQSADADPTNADSQSDLALLLGSMGRFQESLTLLRRAVDMHPAHAPSWHNLAITLERIGALEEAVGAYRRAVELNPHDGRFHVHLGSALRKLGRLQEAAVSYQQALDREPGCADAWSGLAFINEQLGRVDEAIASCRRATACAPEDLALHSNLLFALHYDPQLSPEQIFREHVAWGLRHESRLAAAVRPHGNDPSPERRLKVGYVSADFREHTRARFLDPLLAHHCHDEFEIFSYSDVTTPDATTERIRRYFDHWRPTASLADPALSEIIRRHEIDILVDLTGHMGRNRLGLFALRPAPIQVSYPGYPNTTGLRGMSYSITDFDRDPEGIDTLYTERLIRLPVSSQCYWPGDDVPDVGQLPCETRGQITFASLNKPIKINAKVLEVWAQILRDVPDSRLVLLAVEEARPTLRAAFTAQGVNGERVCFVPRQPRSDYLRFHDEIDVNLDPWPYNGHTTVLDGLYMGVPAVCLEGAAHVSREGSIALKLVGLAELVAASLDDYVSCATKLAQDRDRLRRIRAELRNRMRRSPLMDAESLARRMENAYRQMWRHWCQAAAADSSQPS
jgi:protein O-GlcNAc transferase